MLFYTQAAATASPDLLGNEPLEVHSNTAEFDDKKGTVFYSGQVEVLQGARYLSSNTLLIERDKDGKVHSMIAKGSPAYFRTQPHPDKPMMEGHANLIHYFPKENKVIFQENAELSQNKESIRGHLLIYDLDKRILTSEALKGHRTTVILKQGST